MSKLLQVTPFMRVPDIDAAVSFFVTTLGFKLGVQIEGYAFVRRDNAAFRLIEDDCPLAPRGGGRYASYIDVQDVDGLYADLKPMLDRQPAGHVCAPFNQDYGQREFTVIGPDGELIAFGQTIEAR